MKLIYLFRSLFATAAFISSFVFANDMLPLEAYAALPEASLVRISPDGNRIAYRYVQSNKDYLVVMDLKLGKLIRAVDIKNIEPYHIFFIDNDRLIFKVAQTGRHYRAGAAFLYDLKNQDLHQLLKPENGVSTQGNYGKIVGIDYKNNRVLMAAFYKRDDRLKSGTTQLNLLAVDLAGKKGHRPLSKSGHGTYDFFVDEHGHPLVQELFSQDKDLHRIEVRRNDEWVEIFRETTPLVKKQFTGLTPDRTKLVFLTYDKSGRNNYYTMSLSDGKIEGPVLVKKGTDISGVLTDVQRIVYGVSYSGFYPSYAFFDKKQQAIYQAIQAAVPADHALSIVDFHPGWKDVVFRIEGPEAISQYLLFSDNEFSFLADARPLISLESFNPIEVTQFKARDGLTIPTLLTYPVNKDIKKNLPTILFPHGGPQAYDRVGFGWLAQYFANRGYLVIQPQFRGSQGFGANHIVAGHGEWGGKMQNDLTDAIDYYVSTGLVDKSKVCIVGFSYGGYAALAGGAYTPEKYSCIIAGAGISDLSKMLDDKTRDYGEESSTVFYWERFLLNRKNDKNLLSQISPVNFAKQFQAPVLLVHGLYDRVVPYKQSLDMESALKDANKVVKLVTLQDEGHYLELAESRLKLLQEIEPFLAENMK
ncbi:prolyl oligopeptidase family serine peptidase [Catenovulum sp. 2E275]|uniref:alpha/beta hydrolase family protein n=1 Tax=Catenovulum sp. 2E275 TaxID=2980497 RepID=UPI0021CFA929|nr:prolyl oligopeptidase family serine peptidase [Catenovulum sp. 2E275]MCU4675048.1 prolyl oligopeptidase family serine peptidase [Catenovulum sp. 2E275]